MWNEASIRELETALDTYDWPAAEEICGRLLEQLAGSVAPCPLPEAAAVLRALRRKRQFGLMRRAANAVLESGQQAAIVRRQYAQALIEHGELGAALDVLHHLITECAQETGEVLEARGLIGRVHKQRYVASAPAAAAAGGAVTAARRQHLEAAIASYWAGYEIDTTANTWHGVNVVSLVKRAARDDVALQAPIDAGAVAAAILATLRQRWQADGDAMPAFEIATAAESCWALDLRAEALVWYTRYVADKARADAFEFASTLRQLREVCQLRDDGDGADVLAVLGAARLAREGGSRKLGEEARGAKGSAQLESTRSAFEKVFSPDSIVTHDWYRLGDQRARAVGRVEDPVRKPFGTGFLVPASLVLAGAAPDAQIFITNAHVVSGKISSALPVSDARVCFEAGDASAIFSATELVWESSPDELDATLLILDRRVDVAPLVLAPAAPEPDFVEKTTNRRFYAIGYPKGGRLALSIDDNLQVGWKRPRLHYRTPTEPGSSGSPIFDRFWQLVALHHSGRSDMPRLDGKGTYSANEGLWIHDVIASARAAMTAR